MIPVAAVIAGLANGPAVDLDVLTLPQAAAMNGWVVRATVTVVNPPDFVGWWSVLGDDTGVVVRSVVVPRDWGVRSGDVLRVVGVLEVIRRPAAVVNGVRVPAWDEVRVTGWRVR